MSIPAVQTRLGTYATNRINRDFKTNITLSQIGLQFNGDIELKGIVIKDYKEAVLISVEELNTSIISFKNLSEGKLNFGDIDMESIYMDIITYKGETESNLDIFVSRFDKDNPSAKESGFLLSSSDITIANSRFKFIDQNLETPNILDFKDLNINATDFVIFGPNVKTRINTLSFSDFRGFEVHHLMTNFSYSLKEMAFKDLKIQTPKSKLQGELLFNYDRKDFKYFTDKVKLNAKFKNSSLALDELNVFYNEFGENYSANFDGDFSGTLNDLNLENLNLNTSNNTKISGDIVFKNLFNKVDDTFKMIADFSQVSSNYSKLKELLPNVLGTSIPASFSEVGNFNIEGTTTITAKNIEAKLDIMTDIGLANTNIKIDNITSKEKTIYDLNLQLEQFNLGPLLGDEHLGETSLNFEVKGKGFNKNNLESQLNGVVTSVVYNNYTYNEITVNGTYDKNKFNGQLLCNDENLKLDFNGLADLSKKPRELDFTAKINYANLKALNFYKRDNKAIFKGVVNMKMSATTVDDASGMISFYETTYTNENDSYNFDDFVISSSFKGEERLVTINSPDIIEGQIKGQFKVVDIPALFENSIQSIYTNYVPHEIDNQYLDFNFKIYNKVVEVFFPELNLAPNTSIRGKVRNDAKAFKFTFVSPQIRLKDYFANKVEVQVDNSNPLFNTYVELDSLNTKYYNLSKFNLINVTLNDTLYIRSDFKGGKQNKDSFDLSLYYTINKDNKSVLGFKKSNVFYNNTNWQINKNSNALNKIAFARDFKDFDIKDFLINSGDEEIKVGGQIKESSYRDLKLNFKNVELAKLLPEIDSVTFAGTINGKLDWFQDKDIFKPNANLTVNQLKINDQLLGDFQTNITGNNSLTNYLVSAKIKDDKTDRFTVKGTVDVANETSNMNLVAKFNQFSLKPLNPFLQGILKDIRGEVNGLVKISGKATKPSFDGDLKLNNAGLAVPYLNVDYAFKENASVTLKEQSFLFNSINITDTKKQTKGILKGSISHVNFNKWQLDIGVSTDRLLILDTKYTDEVLYYGTGYIGGDAYIQGPTEALVITVDAQTKAGTVFKIPLNENETFGDNNFIHFLSPEEKQAKQSGDTIVSDNSQGLEMNFDLDITQDAEIEIVIDKNSGSTIKGRGAGFLLFDINTNGKFNMYGDFVIYEGIYNFFYAGLVQKKFNVKPIVSTLSWNGEPFNALINIKAIYKTRANPSPLLDNPINRSIPVELGIELNGRLEKPEPTYDFNFPTVDSTIKSELSYRLDSEEERENQALFLLASGSFNGGFADVNFSGTITERLNGIINGFFDDSDNKLNIGLNYEVGQNRPDYQTDDRVGVTLQTKLSDRIVINGKVGVPIGGATESVIAGDVQVDFLLNEDGTLTAKVFNRENSIRNFGEEIGYTQGVGISYSLDFDTFGELIREIFTSKKKRQEKEDESKKIDEEKKDNPLPDDVGFKTKPKQ